MVDELCVAQNLRNFMKMVIFQGDITPKLSGGGNPKIGGAPQLMLRNIPVKFEDSRSRGC